MVVAAAAAVVQYPTLPYLTILPTILQLTACEQRWRSSKVDFCNFSMQTRGHHKQNGRKELHSEVLFHFLPAAGQLTTGGTGISVTSRLPPRSRWKLRSLGNYAAYSGNSLPTFQDNLSVPSSTVGPTVCP